MVKPMIKEERVGLYIMPETRIRLNLVKAQLSMREGRPLNQDETLQRLIRLFEHAIGQNNGHVERKPEYA